MTQFVTAENIKPHFSTKLWRGYYLHLKENYSETLFNEICQEAGMPPEYLLGDDNWVSNTFLCKFLEVIKKRTGDMDIAKAAGTYSLSRMAINSFEYSLLENLGPFLFFRTVPNQFEKLSLINKCRLEKSRPGNFEFVITPNSSEKTPQDACSNTLGVFEATKEIYKYDKFEISHNECIHRGSPQCVFKVKYSALSYWKKKSSGLFLAILTFLLFKFSLESNSAISGTLRGLTSVITPIFLIFGIFYFLRYRNLIKYSTVYYVEGQRKNQALYESKVKLDRRYQESNLIRNLSLKLIKLDSSKEVVSSSLNDLEKRFGFERAVVQLVDTSNSKLFTVDVRGFGEHTDMLFKLTFKYPAEKDSPQIFANILESGKCTLIDDIDKFKKDLEPQNQLLLTAFGVKSLIVAPIQDATTKYGLLIIGSIGADRKLTTEDQHLIENITRMLALFFQNARNFEKERTLKTLFQKYVPPIVIDGIRHLEAGESGHLIPKNNAVSSIFVDLRDFTAISEDQAPQRVVEMLNLYIDYVSNFVALDGGIIDNLVGDGVVAFFPAADDDRVEHARKGLKCAIRILANLDNLNEKLMEKGFPKVRIGIGLHSGNATVGNIGSDRKMNYTAIGDTVNLASRLETLCKNYADATPTSEQGLLIFSEGVYGRARLKIPKIEGGKIRIRGRHDLVQVYLLDKQMAMGIDLDNLEFLERNTSETLSSVIDLDEPEGRRRSDKKRKKVS